MLNESFSFNRFHHLKSLLASVTASLAVFFTLLFSQSLLAKEYFVDSPKLFKKTVKSLRAGDTVILKNGIYKDFDIAFYGTGKIDAPITLQAETKGEVIITGKSNLRISGEYIVVSGLVFKDGYTPKSEVISFRRSKEHYAIHSRITEVVVDHFNKTGKFNKDIWVGIYGRNNRFDHNYLVGKENKGVTLAIRLNEPEFLNNNHRVDHNYFGPRPVLGANGGETLRIGTSKYSLENSNSVVEFNFFDRCNGEVEIISNKSGGNIYRNNVFYESQGTLTLRHGNNNLVENNLFFGNGVEHTGGIRIINANQTVRNNYMYGLKGGRFGGAFVVMNGSYNPPINRYHQVKNARIENNSIMNSDNILFAAGKDAERNAPPVDSLMQRNFIYSEKPKKVFTTFDDISGIDFRLNALSGVESLSDVRGLHNVKATLEKNEFGLWYPVESALKNIGVSRDLVPISKDSVGPSWYSKPPKNEIIFLEPADGSEIIVTPEENALEKAVSTSKPGSVIKLRDGHYLVEHAIEINHPLTIVAENFGKANVKFKGSNLFVIQNSGSLKLKGLDISGRLSREGEAANSVIRTRTSVLNNYHLILDTVKIEDLNNHDAFNFIDIHKDSFAYDIQIINSEFKRINGSVLALNKQTDDNGSYNVEYLNIKNSRFVDINKEVINLYRGGRDESTFGPHLNVTDSYFENIGFNLPEKSWRKAIFLYGVQSANFVGNTFKNNAEFTVKHSVGEPKTVIVENTFENSHLPTVSELESNKKSTALVRDNEITDSK